MYPWKRGEGVAAVPAWARGHDDGHVVRDGVQQSGGRARQRWRCTLPDASYHRFLGVMSRTRALDETCVECENHLEVHEGPVAPSTFEYLVREVATALVSVGRGMSYTDAAKSLPLNYLGWCGCVVLGMGEQRVVPLSMELVASDLMLLKGFHLFVGDLDAFGVGVGCLLYTSDAADDLTRV